MFVVEVAEYLDSLNLLSYSEAAGGDTFIAHVPAKPDEVVVITPTSGTAPEFDQAYDKPSFQVRVRGTIQGAYIRAKAILDALHGLGSVEIGDTHVVMLTAAQSEPESIGADENGRHEYTVNFDADVRAAVTANRS